MNLNAHAILKLYTPGQQPPYCDQTSVSSTHRWVREAEGIMLYYSLGPLLVFASQWHVDNTHQFGLVDRSVCSLLNLGEELVITLRTHRQNETSSRLQLLHQLKRKVITSYRSTDFNTKYYLSTPKNSNLCFTLYSTIHPKVKNGSVTIKWQL